MKHCTSASGLGWHLLHKWTVFFHQHLFTWPLTQQPNVRYRRLSSCHETFLRYHVTGGLTNHIAAAMTTRWWRQSIMHAWQGFPHTLCSRHISSQIIYVVSNNQCNPYNRLCSHEKQIFLHFEVTMHVLSVLIKVIPKQVHLLLQIPVCTTFHHHHAAYFR